MVLILKLLILKFKLNYLKQNVEYNQAKEYGIEYFQCDLNMLINDIQNLINKN